MSSAGEVIRSVAVVGKPASRQRSHSHHRRCCTMDKVALITGGGGTIGKAIAKALLTKDISVILTGRRFQKLEEAKQDLLRDISPTTKASVHVISSDISKEESVTELFKKISEIDEYVDRGGLIDILVNNAGINATANTLDELKAADMEAVLGVNVVGAFLCAREAIKQMKQKDNSDGNGRGRIINIGSISAFSPRPNSTAYTTSKFAIMGLSKSLALDGREHGIAVGIIHPGNVISELLSPEDVEVRGRTEGFLRPEDVAQCVLTMAQLPYAANVLEMTVLPTSQPFIGRG